MLTTTLPPPMPAAQAGSVVDRHGRRLRYVRVSVTDVCNLSCQYCNPVKGCGATHPHRLSWDDLDFLVDVCVNDLGVEAIRVTGGEPTVRPGLAEWIGGIRRHAGLRDVALTTNGMLLERLAPALASAGLDRVNVSIDTFDAARFAAVTRGGSFERVMAGIAAARRMFRRVKLNAVLLRGFNDGELGGFVRYSAETDTEVRFIELMPIFDEKEYFERHFLPVAEAMAILAAEGWVLEPLGDGPAAGNRTGYGPATTYAVRGTRARVGFISQMSDTKCLSCNKLRLTSDGALKPCLLSPKEVDLVPAIQARDRRSVSEAMRSSFLGRPERYDDLLVRTESLGRRMQAVGG